MRIGVISNPRSRQNLHGMAAIGEVLARSPDVLHIEAGRPAQVAAALRDLARREVGLVVVNGGDGTVQATLTALFNEAMFERPPRLAVLPAGMTNLIALDVGLKGRRDRALARLIERSAAGDGLVESTRPVLALRYAADGPPVYGMFGGAAAFYRATLLGRNEVHALGAQRSVATGLALGLSVLQVLLRRHGGSSGLFRGDRMTIEVDGRARPEREYLLLLATTLDRLLLGLRPFWGGGAGRLRHTSIDFPPRRFARALVPTLRGRPRPWMADCGYVSGRADRMALYLTTPFVLDGEIFMPTPGVPLTLTADRRAVFVTC